VTCRVRSCYIVGHEARKRPATVGTFREVADA
jgi:hypothetical protein